MGSLNQLSWNGVAFIATVPPLVGLMIAYPFWRKGEPILGNVAGTLIIFGAAFALIWREHIVLDRIVQACLDENTVCWPEPSAFTRFAVYAFIALFEVFALFSLSLRVEEKIRRSGYAPEWK